MPTEWDHNHEPESGRGVLGSWGAVFRDVRALAADLGAAGTEMARQIPLPELPSISQLAELGDTGRARVEEALLRELKTRMNALDAPHRPYQSGGQPSPAELLDTLLQASIDINTHGSRDELYRALLRQLVPDEARILAALSDGTGYPLIHVQPRSHGGGGLENVSTVGRAAGVSLPDKVSTYVLHLRNLGLAEEGPADDSLSVQYDILLGEPSVRHAEQEARSVGRFGARLVRRTLRISALGRELWLACRPEPTVPPLAPAGPSGRNGSTPAAHPAPGQHNGQVGLNGGAPRSSSVYRPSSAETDQGGAGGTR